MARGSEHTSLLGVLLTEHALRIMAGPVSYERGERYAVARRVKEITVDGSEISAVVEGSERYYVRIWSDEDGLGYSCSCPVGKSETFCKHGVAAGLTWLRGISRIIERDVQGSRMPDAPVPDIRSYLHTLDEDALIDLLMTRVADDELFEGTLGVMATAATALPGASDAFRQAIEAAIVVSDFVDYHSMPSYSRDVSAIVKALDDLFEVGHGVEVIGLCEYTLGCVEDAIGRVDDSDGRMGEIRDELVELHHRACVVVQPNPEELAERLFDWGVHSQWEIFLDGAERYADVLGEVGLLCYRALAEQVWVRVSVRHDDGNLHSALRFRITFIMEALARVSGSVDELVAVKARTLTYAYHYVQIVDIVADAGRFVEALEWCERGLAAFPNRTDVRLRDVAARELHRAGRDGEAMSLLWTELEENTNCSSYELLHRHASEVDAWSLWRERALDLLREREGRARSIRARGGDELRDPHAAWRHQRGVDENPESSELVKVFLWESDVEAAWAQAQIGGCSSTLWMQLASLRGHGHPGEVIPIYQEAVERAIGAKNNHAYQSAVKTMLKVLSLMELSGRRDEFVVYAAEVRAAHKAKRNLMKLFDKERW